MCWPEVVEADAEVDDGHGEGREGFERLYRAVVADPQSPQPLDPADRALDDPADLSQSTAMFGSPLADQRLDAQRSAFRVLSLSYPASAITTSGFCFGRPTRPEIAGSFSLTSGRIS